MICAHDLHINSRTVMKKCCICSLNHHVLNRQVALLHHAESNMTGSEEALCCTTYCKTHLSHGRSNQLQTKHNYGKIGIFQQ